MAPFLGLLAILLVLFAFGHSQRAPRLYRLALVAPFEGIYRDSGYAALEAVRARVSDWNRRLAPYHLQLQLWAVNDGDDAGLALTRAQELAADPLVLAVIGHMAPKSSGAASSLYQQVGLLQVSPVVMFATSLGEKAGPSLSLGPAPGVVATLAAGHPGTIILDLADPDVLHGQVVAGLAGPSQGSGGQRPQTPVLLPYGYCPPAIAAVLPLVQVQAAAGEASLDGTAASLAARAADLALQAIFNATTNGRPERASVAANAVSAAENSGWVWQTNAWYPSEPATAIPCPAG